MFQLFIFAIVGYLFFKYMWPLLKSNNPIDHPTELSDFYTKHPKLFVLTVMLALLGFGELFNIVMGLVGFIFVSCPTSDSGTIGIMCWIKNGILGIS